MSAGSKSRVKGWLFQAGYPLLARWVFRARCYPSARKCLTGRRGLEIGGPSPIFDYSLPIYRCVANLDNCVFSKVTTWEGERDSGLTFRYNSGKRIGHNFIAEGSDLDSIKDHSYEFVLSSHNLEHIANPLKALHNWKRVLRPDGFMILVLPDKDQTFDYLRPVTPLDHLCQDYARGTGEDDASHIDEFVTLWDYGKYPIARNAEEHRRRYQDNYSTRLVHHHVFDLKSAAQMVEYSGFKILSAENLWPNNLVILAQI